MKSGFWILPLVMGMAGCTEYATVESPPSTVSFTSKAAQSASTGLTDVTVRAVKSTAKGRQDDQEMLGAQCDVTGTGFSGKVVTPGILKVPSYVGAADPIRIACTAGGESAQRTVEPVNRTVERMTQSTVVPGGLVGALVVAAAQGAAVAARDPLKDEFSYPGLAIVTFGPQ